MTFVSYAQNYEDVMLLRALRGVEQGFYVDVGAQDPVEDSVTKAFYELGWHGINVEPVMHWHDRLLQDRPRDTTLRVLAGAHEGTARFFEVGDTGLSTMDADLAARHAAAGHRVVPTEIHCTTLDAILAEAAPPVIHFLKIDVEGAEAEVLSGLSLRDYRPWILLIEARAPNSTVETHDAWEPGVLAAGYRLVYQDGLNRFYVAQEQAHLAAGFASPPNVLDDFIRRGEWEVRTRLALLEVECDDRARRLAILHDTVAQRDAQLGQWQSRAEELSGHITRVQQLAEDRQAHIELQATRLATVESEAARLARTSSELKDQVAAAGLQLMGVQAELSSTRSALEQVLSSRSWRLTRPLRVLARLFRHGPEEITTALAVRRRGNVVGHSLPEGAGAADAQMSGGSGPVLSDDALRALDAMDAFRSKGGTDQDLH